MCGICGVSGTSEARAHDLDLVSRMCAAISHRGPDGDGFYSDDETTLGHRRLSIIDLSGGDQPIYNADGSVCIVFNGEIYNYKELREDLLRAGYQFRTQSDTEVIVHLYDQKGEACVEDLNGMFAFAIWDKRQQKLFIARDRLGEKPLYYHFDGKRLLFASELKALYCDRQFTPRLNMEAFGMYLSYGYVPQPHSIVQGVAKLPAGHTMTFSGGKLEVRQYWQVAFPATTENRPEQDWLDEFAELLEDSVRLRLRSDVPVGAFLSGGLDSSLMVALAAGGNDALTTFSVAFSEADYGEQHFARQVAERYGTKHHEIQVKEVDPDLFPRIVDHFDEPFADSSAIPTWYVTGEAAKHLKVCISGDAGDELFCGYTRYQYEPLEAELDRVPAAIRGALAGPLSRLVPDRINGQGRLRRIAVDGAVRWQRMVGPFDGIELTSLLGHPIDESRLFARHFSGSSPDAISRRMWADQETYLPDDILVKVDRNSMWHSLEVRVPFLDHRIVELANRMPLHIKKKNGSLKYPVKWMLKGRVPDELLTRPKHGFSLPIRHWLQSSLQDFAQDLLTGPDACIGDYVDQAMVRKLLHDHARGPRDLSRRIWTLLWFEQWCRGFKAAHGSLQ